jgi:phenylalanyl-tRNA synthetase beta chain
MAPVFSRDEGGPVERHQLVVAQTLEEDPIAWPKAARTTIYDLKAAFTWVWDRMGMPETFTLAAADSVPDWAHPGRVLGIFDGQGEQVGVLAELKPRWAESLRVKRLGIIEMDLGDPRGWSQSTMTIRRPYRYPSAVRDLAFLLSAESTYQQFQQWVGDAVTDRFPDLDIEFWLTDRYVLDPGGTSVTVRFLLQPKDRTLTEAEIAAVLNRVQAELAKAGVYLRQ